mmetsp:Transcript_35270/g.74485  ORF Transcript_35270/g.74485 Transcript_35270/m.74485 type:complete len:98 (+) Transcript_35270:3318-3611(+)
MDIPTNPTIRVPQAQHAPDLDLTCSSKTKIPQKKEVNTIIDDHVPAATASPAARMPKIPAQPPGTQKRPDTIPHVVKRNGSPIGIMSQQVRKHVNVL